MRRDRRRGSWAVVLGALAFSEFTQAPKTTPVVEEPAPPRAAAAHSLADAYEANELAADRDYKAQRVRVRGVVSLAAALAIPLTIASGQPFPYRDMIIFITFGVIFLTLVGLGLTLPAVIRLLGLARHADAERRSEREAERAARLEVIDASQQRVRELIAANKLTGQQIALLEKRHQRRREALPDESADQLSKICGTEIGEMIDAERVHLHQLLRDGKITDEARRRIERELDLEEANIARRLDADELPL